MKHIKRAEYACKYEETRGRLYDEPPSLTRTPFERDRDRIIHSAAFRCLKSKTQVFLYHEGENYRTRLTHSLEVSQIARSVGLSLGLDEALCETLALAHDLGHPPFGHAGERELKECMKNYGGFDHNAHSLRVVTYLEKRYPRFDGLNLSWETLEGLVKHNGPLIKEGIKCDVPTVIKDFNALYDLELDSYSSGEAQVAAISDDIAYNNHDIDDAYHAGILSIEDLKEAPLIGEKLHEVVKEYPHADKSRIIHEAVRRLINSMIYDLVEASKERILESGVKSAHDIRSLNYTLVNFSPEMEKQNFALKDYLFPHVYRHYKVNRMTNKAQRVIRELFELFLEYPKLLPTEFRDLAEHAEDKKAVARIVSDYIAGLTDTSSIDEHTKLFDPKVRP